MSEILSLYICVHSLSSLPLYLPPSPLPLFPPSPLTLSLSLSTSQIEKVLQQGDITESVEPYLKARDLDKKTLEKHKASANFFCQQLGQYRMPFAWTAINVLDIIAGQPNYKPYILIAVSNVLP